MRVKVTIGTLRFTIWPPKGNKGFGYDPIFRPLDHKLTFAEMAPNFKHNISHRSIAFNKLIRLSFPTLSS